MAHPLRESTTLCPLLRGAENYAVWKTKMEMVLIRERLWAIISGRRGRPKEEDSKTTAWEAYDDDAERAMATIFLYLSDTVEQYVRGIRDPIVLWEKLRELFATVGFTARFTLWQRLFTLSNTAKDMGEYLSHVRGIVVGLRESGAEVPEELLVTATLTGLGVEFQDFTTVLVHSGKDLTLDSLTALLVDEAERRLLTTAGGFANIVDSALQVQGSGCWHCGRQGHIRTKCHKWLLTDEGKAYTEEHPTGQEPASTGPIPTPGAKGRLSPAEETLLAREEYTGEVCWFTDEGMDIAMEATEKGEITGESCW